jgi:hypothetical protein
MPASLQLRTKAVLTFLILLLQSNIVACADATLSIEDFNDFQSQRPCLKDCISCVNCGGNFRFFGGDLGEQLGCGDSPPFLDSCFCRQDLWPSASSKIKSCVGAACQSNTVDISRGYSLYNAYCNVQAAATTAAPAATTPTEQPGNVNTGGFTTVVQTVYITTSSTTSSVTTNPFSPYTSKYFLRGWKSIAYIHALMMMMMMLWLC